jgi:Phage tail protein
MALLWPNLFTAAPYGLEVQLVFNGLTMNANKSFPSGTLGAYFITAMGGLDDADVRATADPRPDMHGELPLTAWYGGRTLVIEGYILALNSRQLRVMQQALRQAFAPLTEKSLVFSTGDTVNGDVFINCRKATPLAMREQMQQNYAQFFKREFQISLRASDPRFLAFTASSATSGTNPANNTNIACTNSGNWSSYPVITITGPFNANLVITNTTTGIGFTINTALTGGQVLTIDCDQRTVKLGTANAFYYLTSASQWPTLEPGAQNLQLTGVGGGTAASKVDVAWRHAWM